MENFRMSWEILYHLGDKLRPMIEKQSTWMRRCVSTECRVAITLWVLATPSEYHSVAHQFGVARCRVCQIVMDTCIAVVQKLTPVYTSFPTGDGLKEVVRGLKDKWGVLQCAGSVDGSHVPVTPPVMNHTDSLGPTEVLKGQHQSSQDQSFDGHLRLHWLYTLYLIVAHVFVLYLFSIVIVMFMTTFRIDDVMLHVSIHV